VTEKGTYEATVNNNDLIILAIGSVWLEFSGVVLISLSKRGFNPALGIIGKILCAISPIILLLGIVAVVY